MRTPFLSHAKFFTLFCFCLGLVAPLFAQSGLHAEYFEGRNFDRFVAARTDRAIDFDWRGKRPIEGLGESEFSVRWTGRLTPPESGEFLFFAMVDDGIRLWLDGEKVIEAWGDHDSEAFMGKIYLEKGRSYQLKAEFYNGPLEGEAHLRWQLPSEKPWLGGAAGYNDKPIEPKFYSQPEKPKPQPAQQPKPTVLPQKPVEKKPGTKPASSTASRPVPAVGRPAPAVSRDTIKKYTPKNLQFRQSLPEILPESLPELDNLLALLRDHPSLRVTIEGHTDNVGDAAKNLELSQQRAQAVADYLTKNGIDSERLTAAGFGGTRPVASNETPEGRAKNRRVEFKY